jgi:GTP-binding protein
MNNFIDKVRVFVSGGKGGNGCLSFRREKFMEYGGPNGGDGGQGGSVFFEANSRVTTLMDLAYRPHIKGTDGGPGKSANKAGLDAPEIVLQVPVGTVIYRDALLVADLSKPGQRYLAATGGRGGRGNLSFKTQKNTAPRLYEKGAPGEDVTLSLELKLIADVGFVGFPNAGKSSLLSAISKARPKVADYPFTTLSPHLGVASHKNVHFVCADIPGLIEGAHEGKGLGGEFLRHVERTRVLVHLVDPAGFGGTDAVKGVSVIEGELKGFSKRLFDKPRLLVVSKADLPEAELALKALKKKYPKRKIYCISSATSKGLPQLLDALIEVLSKHQGPETWEDKAADPALLKVDRGFSVVNKGGGHFQLKGQFVERAAAMLDVALPEAIDRFQRTLRRIGVDKALKKAGINDGDMVACGSFEFEWSDAPYKAIPKLRARDPRTRIGVGKK